MFLAATGLAAALVVPMASGSTVHHAKGTKVTKVGKVGKVAKPTRIAKPGGTVDIVVQPKFPPGTLGAVLPDPSVADCTSYGGNCTTQEYCEIWGDNCPSMTPDSSTFPTDGTPANP
jgi:hypothetical protein